MKKLLIIFSLLLTLGCATGQEFIVQRVVDGDTIVLANGEKVRLIGVDTPETKHPRKPVECYGKEASAFTKSTVEGKTITMKYEKNKRDRYERLLAYVYLQDGTLLNQEIIKQGYGRAYTRFPFRYKERFVETEAKAKELDMGLWGVCE